MDIPFLQTETWQNFQTDLGQKTFFKSTSDYTFLAICKSTRFGTYLYLPYGPYLRTKNAAKACYPALETLAKSKNAIFIRIEPQDAENASYLLNLPNCRKTTDLNPAHTWILDLSPEKSTLISNFTQGTRTCYNQFAKKGISVIATKKASDIDYLVDLQKNLARDKKIGVFSKKYLQAELSQGFATLYLAYFDKKVIAASLFFDHAQTRFYMQSAADPEFRKLPATVAILTTAIFDAKDAGFKNFDFWGIAPENAPADHPWAGFTKFKRSFGGYAVNYAGTHDIILNPVRYRFYRLARRGNRFFRKIFKN